MATQELKTEKWIRDLQRSLTKEERQELYNAIKQDRCVYDAVVITSGDVIIDGHNRYEIAKELGLEVPTRTIVFEKPKIEIPLWVWRHQLARRNLSPDDFKLYLGKLYNAEKQPHGGTRGASAQNAHLPGKTAEKIAEEHGVNQATVRRAGKLAEAVDSLPANLQTAYQNKALKGTDEEILALSRLPEEQQQAAARQQRTGGKSLGEAITAVSGKNPKSLAKPATSKRKPKVVEVSCAKLADWILKKCVSPAVRALDNLAKANGGKGEWHKKANDAINAFIGAIKEMRKGQQ